MHKCVGQFNKRVADFRQEFFVCKTREAGGHLGPLHTGSTPATDPSPLHTGSTPATDPGPLHTSSTPATDPSPLHTGSTPATDPSPLHI